MDRERKGEKFIPYYYIPQRIIVFILLLHIITTFNPFIVLQSEFSTFGSRNFPELYATVPKNQNEKTNIDTPVYSAELVAMIEHKTLHNSWRKTIQYKTFIFFDLA